MAAEPTPGQLKRARALYRDLYGERAPIDRVAVMKIARALAAERDAGWDEAMGIGSKRT